MAQSDGGPVVIIGAGLAGLAAAATLTRAGRDVLVLEQQESPGGRVQSDTHAEGFVLDRGFQVLFPAYPAARELFDYASLRLRPFDSGALIAGFRPMKVVANPLARPRDVFGLWGSSLLTPADGLRLAKLAWRVRGLKDGPVEKSPERTTAGELRVLGLSVDARQQFFAPFFGGIFLDRSLQASAAWFRYLFHVLQAGGAAVPAGGMGDLAIQLMGKLPPHALRLRTAVTSIERDPSGRAIGVRAGDESFPATSVIVATDVWSASGLVDSVASPAPLGCTTVYFAGADSLYEGRKIVLNPDPHGFLNECVQITNVAPSYAPRGQHLVACTTLTKESLTDAELEWRSRAELESWFGTPAVRLRLLAVYRTPRAQFPQPPGFTARRPTAQTRIPGLYLAGEYLHSSSIQGALASGLQAARAVLAGT